MYWSTKFKFKILHQKKKKIVKILLRDSSNQKLN